MKRLKKWGVEWGLPFLGGIAASAAFDGWEWAIAFGLFLLGYVSGALVRP